MRAPPTRVVNLDRARGKFGARADLLASSLWKTDPLAEAVVKAFSALPPGKGKRLLDQALDEGVGKVSSAPRALVQLFEQIHDTPFWVDREQLDLGGRALLRTGIFGLFALGAGSLPLSYAPPGANKALAFSRRLVAMAPRRILDTMRFHYSTCAPGGLLPGGEGFKLSIHVRLVHAQMRRILLASGRWNEEAWGAPVNQADAAYANVLFSAYPMAWMRSLGVHFTAEESDAAMQLWRYSGHLLGVDPALLPATEAEARRLGALYEATQAPPDDDARALTRALADAAPILGKRYFGRTEWIPGVFATLARFFLGEERASSLGLPRGSFRPLLSLGRAVILPTEALRRLWPAAEGFAQRAGATLERGIIENGLPPQATTGAGTIEAVLGAQRPQHR